MSRGLILMCSALALTACGTSRTVTSAPRLPAPPSEALTACEIPPVISGDAAGVEAALIERGAAIAACDAKRRALADGWPR